MDEASDLIVSVSGIRGIVGRGLTAEAATAFAAALATAMKGGTIVLSRDGRPSGEMMRHAVLAGLLGAGCDVQDVGVAPTPTCGLAVRRLHAAGAIQITASHNPAPWNGLKLFDSDGRVLTADEGKRVQAIFESRHFRRAPWNQIGTVHACTRGEEWHLERVLELVDVAGIRAARFRPYLDANGGAGGPLGRRLLKALDCDTTCRACTADGTFLHEPEPIAANLADVCPEVAHHGCHIGFVLDPDSDRLALIDETGRYIGEELTLALCVQFRLGQEKGPVVINMSTSRVVEDIAKLFHCMCYRSAVGEANVGEKMRAEGAVIGGEGNGGVIDPRVGFVRDPFIGIGMILSLMAQQRKKLSELVAALPAYTIVKDKYTVTRERLPALFDTLARRWPDAHKNHLDGLRLDWDDRWIHVRPSNTEPIVRVIAEAPREADAKMLCEEVGALFTAPNP